MNIQLIAVALRALADAIETPASAETTTLAPGETAGGPVRRGRPPKAAPAAAAVPSATEATPSASPATPAPAAPAPTSDPMAVAQTAPLPAGNPMAVASSVPAQGQTQVIPAQVPGAPAGAGNGELTHAMVAPDFTTAGRVHGRDFVIETMALFGAKAYDKVPKDQLAKFRATLQAGPQPKADPNNVADLMK